MLIVPDFFFVERKNKKDQLFNFLVVRLILLQVNYLL